METTKKILIFHHSDLDGIGVRIISTIFAKERGFSYETYKCDYGNVNEKVTDILDNTDISEIEMIIIGDISVDERVAQRLQGLYETNINIVLRDHHATAEWLNKYEWALVTETVNSIPRCGTWLLHKKLGSDTKLDKFVDTVDDWDTWKWVENDNYAAKKLNSLLQIIGADDFTDNIINCGDILTDSDMFPEWAQHYIAAHTLLVEKQARNCERSMYTTDLSVRGTNKFYKTGFVFCNSDISDVANIILENNPEIDILVLFGFPSHISLRTRKSLDIELGSLAEILTGEGGGHPKSAGSRITSDQFKLILTRAIKDLSRNDIEITKLDKFRKE